tara:strand:- start:125 stop:421 length:297 start_codon:yes stop_codon:yes gene_type:complete
MKKKQIKKLKQQAKIIQVEWLRSLLSEEEGKQITIDNVSEYISEQTHTFLHNQFELLFMSDRWVLKQLKKNPHIKTYKELETLFNQKKQAKEELWMNM